MKIQANIPKDINKKLKIVKLVNDFKDLPETVIQLLKKILDSDIVTTKKIGTYSISIMED